MQRFWSDFTNYQSSRFFRVLELLEMKQVGRNYYNPKMSTVVQCQRVSFELWPGFLTSILQYEKKVLLCAEVSHKVSFYH